MAMAKKSWLFHLLKKLFVCESKPLTEKKSKRWGWFYGRFKLKQLPTAAEADYHAVTSSLIFEARAEQREHAINVARATAVAAEAAVAAAQAAAEVVRLSGMPHHHLQLRDKGIRSLAAIRIQTAFRAFLARKALKALKGLVRLQAIARGRAVRRQTCHRLKHLASSPSTANNRSEFHVIKLPVIGRSCGNSDDKDQSLKLGDQGLKIETKCTRRWNDSLFCRDEIESLSSAKHDAMTRKERMQQYSFSHKERQFADILEEPFTDTGCNERQIYLLKHLADDKSLHKMDKIERISSFNLTPSTKDHRLDGNQRMRRQRSLHKQDTEDELLMNLPFSSSCPRRSFCHHRRVKHKPNCSNHDGSCTSSPGIPSYMATTESAKAKMRSLSTPRQRLGYRDTCFDDQFGDKEYNNNNNNNSMSSSTWSCCNCEETKGIGKGSHCFHQLKSLSMRSLQEPTTMISE